VIQPADFLEQIPEQALSRTDIFDCGDITVFKPYVYMGGVNINVEDYHIVIPSENTPEVLFNNKRYSGCRRSVLAVNPGDTVTCLTNAPAKPYYSVLLRPRLIRRIAEEMNISGELSFVNIHNPCCPELLRTVRSLELEAARCDRLKLMMDSLELQTAVILLRELETNVRARQTEASDTGVYVSLAEEYIRANFSSNITLKDICDAIHVSRYHFIRMFGKTTGLTPHKYLTEVRMEKAKELLRSGNYSVTEAAMLCGFESIPHFSETFKKSTGFTPVDYKKMS
jgi:AraC family transcriptional regulator